MLATLELELLGVTTAEDDCEAVELVCAELELDEEEATDLEALALPDAL